MKQTILGLDTSAKTASAAVYRDGRILAECYCDNGLTHSQTVMQMISDTLKLTRLPLSEIDVYAVTAGPGSFTGLRIGLSCVKGLCLPHDKPCAAVSTLESIAALHLEFTGLICAVMDARCGQVYNAVFEAKDTKLRRVCDDRALPIHELYDELRAQDKPVLLAGDGAVLCWQSFEDTTQFFLASPALRFCRASAVCLAADEIIQNKETVSCDALMPRYLRLPQAQREREARINKKTE